MKSNAPVGKMKTGNTVKSAAKDHYKGSDPKKHGIK